jgi:hypothetical protein
MHRDLAQLSTLPSIDADYRFGRPKVYLTPHELARLIIVRSRLGDTHAERVANAAGSATSGRSGDRP